MATGRKQSVATDRYRPFAAVRGVYENEVDSVPHLSGGAGLVPGTPENELTDVRGGELPVVTPSLCRQAPSPCKPQTSGRGC